jgi:hypothetical protein
VKKKARHGKGHTGKHSGTHKHHAHGHKHHPSHQPVHGHGGGGGGPVHVKAKHPHHHRGLAVTPSDLACCAAEALAASLRLAGWPAGDEDVVTLFGLTADTGGDGATMLATLEAAAEFGLAGRKPRSFGLALSAVPPAYPLILGLSLPEGRHFVTDDGAVWWSWGEPMCPCEFDAVIEEAWEVAW